jgi:V/A-type H+-transporting ATPase subunit I
VFDGLAIVPGYREYEVSVWFLAFFSIFFGMIIGDAAYGVIILAIAVWQALKQKRRAGRVPDFLRLLFILAGTTIAWGALTGTWFSLDTQSLPPVLRALILPVFSGNPKLVTQNVMQFCFILAVIQLSVAHLKNIRRDFPGLKFVAQIGWLMMVIGLYSFVLNMVVDRDRFPIRDWNTALVGAGFLLYFVFANQEGKFFRGILTSVINVIPTFLGAVSCFADIISYIRLFAVGLAGVAIAQTVNGMVQAMPAGVARIAAGSLLLIFGHSLNLVLGFLSVVVHGIRLNMLEFSGHLGMEWSGVKYTPFSAKVKR